MSRVAMVLVLACAGATAAAQQAPRAQCPVVNGIVATTSAGDSTPARRDSTRGLRIDATSIIDTTWTFDIRERRWSRPSFAASVGAGWSGGSSLTTARGMTTAPDSAAGRDWSVCAAVSIGMREPTLVLRNARGTVHLRADVSALTRSASPARDSTTRPR